MAQFLCRVCRRWLPLEQGKITDNICEECLKREEVAKWKTENKEMKNES